MALRQVRIWPDPVLTTVAQPVETFDAAIKTLVADMFETMYAENGVGLAANQVGVLQRILVIDLDPQGEAKNEPEIAKELEAWGFDKPTAFINPEIVSKEGKISWEEGCLSVPGITESVDRAEHVVVKAFTPDGDPFTIEAHGLYAVALQHELDHLNGKVFVEYLSKLKRDVIRRKMTKLKSEVSAAPPAESHAAL